MSTTEPTVVVTGANGFVGRAVCAELIRRGYLVRRIVRDAADPGEGGDLVRVPDISSETDWNEALRGKVDVVFHLAARVHIMRNHAANPLEEFYRVNTAGTEHLARAAAAMGVRRFVYVSSIKVNGEQTAEAQTFAGSDPVAPQDAYAISKWQAEQALQQVARETGMEIVIVRPPLVYGPGVKGNFLRLLQAVDKGIPLPLAQVHNARSMLYLDNLTDILLLCASHPAAAGKTYLVRDGEDIATPDLVRSLSEGMGRRARLLSVPLWLLRALATVIGQYAAFERLTGSLRIDDSSIRRELGWQPQSSLQQGLQMTVAWYLAQKHPPSGG